ncbi:right-handed parallel beta-helix repeat-containing protein [Armatimonas sp.]|uniref:right-handed parallel beta-helix repeat-containing protein n=1 Tax=Armatimonas sp. TaxID=1872638 RepID=UPI00286AC0BF|nr:right-handed parallel beta-helix repeat-containing protein [Armatimonas sp.]
MIILPQASSPLKGSRKYEPDWATVAPKRILRHADTKNDALAKAVAALQPGDKLVLAAGTYVVERMWDIRVSGTAAAPIWIEAEEGATVIFTRPDAKQNVLNIGQGGPVHHLCLRGIELTGGSHGLRLGQCREVWIDQCHIHHTGEVCLSANSANTRRLFLTSNHLHHGGGHGEGMYLGANNGEFVMSESVIALNHVHDCKGSQGDGIEVKQGSWGNLIAENDIHDTQYPCITVYGTAGKPVNIIERNLCRRSGDHNIQVQGEAIVRNNVLMSAKGSGLASTDHQGKTRNLQVIHNTIINTGNAFSGGSWNGREGMVLANNILYSRDKNAVHFANGSDGVVITGNVIVGDGSKKGTVPGRGLADFVNATWDGEKHDVRPVPGAPLESADPRMLVPTDFTGRPRTKPLSGAMAR